MAEIVDTYGALSDDGVYRLYKGTYNASGVPVFGDDFDVTAITKNVKHDYELQKTRVTGLGPLGNRYHSASGTVSMDLYVTPNGFFANTDPQILIGAALKLESHSLSATATANTVYGVVVKSGKAAAQGEGLMQSIELDLNPVWLASVTT